MTTESAIRAMLDGKKVNRKDFVEEVYAYEKGVFFNQYGMTIQGFGDNDDWEIYEEPKPKQTVVLYEQMGNSTKILIKDEKENLCGILIIAMPKEDLLLDLKKVLLGRGVQDGTDLASKHFNCEKNLAFMLCYMLVEEYQKRNYPALPLMEIGEKNDYAENKIIIQTGQRLYEDSQVGFNKALSNGHSPSLRAIRIKDWISL